MADTPDLDTVLLQYAELFGNNDETKQALQALDATLRQLHGMGTLRCEITGRPCGTDEWPPGAICGCLCCQAWAMINLSPGEFLLMRAIDPITGESS